MLNELTYCFRVFKVWVDFLELMDDLDQRYVHSGSQIQDSVRYIFALIMILILFIFFNRSGNVVSTSTVRRICNDNPEFLTHAEVVL